MKKFFTLIAAVFASSAAMFAQDVEWGPQANPNVDCEGADFSFYAVKPNYIGEEKNGEVFTGETLAAVGLAEGKGVDGSKAISILSKAGAVDDWDSQFWIVLPKDFEVGEHVKVKFDYRADYDTEVFDNGVSIGTQAHGLPGDYHHWQCIGDVVFTGEWQTYEYEITVTGDMMTSDNGEYGFHSVAFNLCNNNKDQDVTFYIDNLEVYYEKVDETLVKYWKPVISGGDCEGGASSNFIFRVQGKGDVTPDPVDGVGMEGSAGLELVVPAKNSQTWDHQFFIKMNESIPAGDMIKISFDYRASEDTPEAIDTQSHGQSAGDYNFHTAVGSMTFGTEWKHYEFTQSVSSDQSPEDKGYQYIAFNLAHFDHEVTLYLDNITVKHQVLVPAGENPAKLALDEYITALDAKYANLSDKANNDIKDAFEQAISDAKSLGEEDDFEAVDADLHAAEAKYLASVKDYSNLEKYIALINEKKEQADDAGYGDLAKALEDMAEPLQQEWDNAVWTREDINVAIDEAALYNKVRESVMPLVAPGKDVTILMNNSDYRWGTSSWAGNFTARASAGEKWHASFDAYQTLANMPAGAYTLKVKGFQRHDTNDNGEVGVQDAVAYVNDNSKLLMDGTDDLFDPFPSSMESVREAFDAAPEVFTNEMSAILTEAGDMKIGVKGTNGLNWVIWSDWQIIYEGESKASYAAAIEQAVEIAKNTKEQLEESLNGPAIDKCDDLTLAGENMVAAIASTSDEDAQKMLDDLKAILTELKDASAAVQAVDNNFSSFETALDMYEFSAADDIVKRAKEARDKYDDYLNMTTDDLKAYAEDLAYLTGALKVDKDAYSATDANPAEIEVFENPDFEDYQTVGANNNYPGWSGSGFGTGGGTAGPVAERWNQSNGFDTYVDLAGLPEGSYTLSCDGAYRVGGGVQAADWAIVEEGADNANIVYLYAKTSDAEASAPIHNIAEGGMTAEEAAEVETENGEGIDVANNCTSSAHGDVTYYFPDQLFTADQWIKAGKYLDNKVSFKVGKDGKVRVGARRKGAGNDWCFLDNFKLTYYGANSEVGVQGVEVVKSSTGVYTISGVRVNKVARPGLYILNGKKVVVK